jgi:hypothetical protein
MILLDMPILRHSNIMRFSTGYFKHYVSINYGFGMWFITTLNSNKEMERQMHWCMNFN